MGWLGVGSAGEHFGVGDLAVGVQSDLSGSPTLIKNVPMGNVARAGANVEVVVHSSDDGTALPLPPSLLSVLLQ